MTNPTIVIICGATTTTEHYASLQASFEVQGYPTACATPPSITVEDAASVTVGTDAAFVRDHVLKPLIDCGKDVVLLMHSYGGVYGGASVAGLSKRERQSAGMKGGVLGLIYIASFCAKTGESAMEAIGNETELGKIIAPGDKPNTVIFTSAAGPVLYPSLSEENAMKWLALAKPISASAISTPVTYSSIEDPLYQGFIADIHASQDILIPVELNMKNREKAGIKLTGTVIAGHGIDQENRSEVVDTVVQLTEVFKSMKL